MTFPPGVKNEFDDMSIFYTQLSIVQLPRFPTVRWKQKVCKSMIIVPMPSLVADSSSIYLYICEKISRSKAAQIKLSRKYLLKMSTKPSMKLDTYRSWALTKLEVLGFWTDSPSVKTSTDSSSIKTGPINEDNWIRQFNECTESISLWRTRLCSWKIIHN